MVRDYIDMVGNEITYNATVTNTISRAPVEGTNWGTYMADKWFNTHDLEELLTKSTFAYTLQETQSDHHSGLSANETTWSAENSATFDVSLTQEFETAGINKPMELYFSESFYLPALECWGFVVQGCHREDYKDTFHSYLGDDFVFDVFPQTFNQFIALTKTNSGAYRPRWSNKFPGQSDADANGRRCCADPNDGTWDTDGDGLSDFWETENGFDAEDADPDGDNLPDYWEAFYDTDPYQQDSDGDGLWDGAEFFHSQSRHPYEDDNSAWTGGWTIVYDYDANDDRLETLVSADPNDYDSDDDTILDNLEYIYGYNPNVASVVNVLSLDAGVDTDLVAIGDTIVYTATVGNELDNRVADGLIEVEFPVDTLQTTKVIGSLYPQMETAVSGSITAPAVAASTTSSVTIRAGAVIETSSLDQVLVLNFNEDAGSTTFYDATSNRLDFTCSSSCPTANGDTITMAGSQSLTLAHDDKLNQDAFSIVTWIKPTVANKIIYNDDNDLWLKLNNNKQFEVILDGSTTQLTGDETLALDEWHHVVVTVDNLNGEVQIFVNGQLP